MTWNRISLTKILSLHPFQRNPKNYPQVNRQTPFCETAFPPTSLHPLLPPICPRITAHPLNRGLQWQFNKARRPIVANVARYKPIGLTLHMSLSNVCGVAYQRLVFTYGWQIFDSISIGFFIWIFFCFTLRWTTLSIIVCLKELVLSIRTYIKLNEWLWLAEIREKIGKNMLSFLRGPLTLL